MEASYAYALCTAQSSVGAIESTPEAVFTTDHTGIAFTSRDSLNVSLDISTGLVTFNKSGAYHVCVVLQADQNGSSADQTLSMKIGNDSSVSYADASSIYSALLRVNTGYDPTEGIHQRIVEAVAGNVLYIRVSTSAGTMGIDQGSSLIITRVVSDTYSGALITGNQDEVATEFNPFNQTSGSFDAGNFKNNGIAYNTSLGKFTVPEDGKYHILSSNVVAIGSGADVNGDVKICINKNAALGGAGTLVSGSFGVKTYDDPSEYTLSTIEDLDADDYLTLTLDFDQDSAGAEGIVVGAGTSLSIMKFNDGVVATNDLKGYYGDKRICVQSIVNSSAEAGEFNPFDSDYTSAVTTRTSSGITYTAASGIFTVDSDGMYVVEFTPSIAVNASSNIVLKMKINGIAGAVVLNTKIALTNSPADRSLFDFVNLKAGDYVEVSIENVAGSNTCTANAGSLISIYRFHNFTKTESAPDGLISDDYTINTFSQTNLSAQYDRNPGIAGGDAQVPFKFGIRGAGTLRGRITNPSVVKIGDKKS